MAESSVVIDTEIPKYHDLGLGRGVNVTDPQMWRNKSPFQIRKVRDDLSNIIGTEESGIKEQYEKEVSTVATQQLKIKLSLNEPSSQVRIGMDAQNSQSTSSTMKIAGIEIRKRTVSFRVDCSDLPVYNSTEDPRTEMSTRNCDNEECLETSLYSWILQRIRDRERGTLPLHVSESSEETDDVPLNNDDLTKLALHLHKIRSQALSESQDDRKIAQEKLRAVAKDCKVFVSDLGITHYVSAIELGALKYSVLTTSSHEENTGAGAQLGAGKMAEGGISGMVGKRWFNKAKKEQAIGRITNDTVTDEAVIGFQIQPIHKLIRLPLLQIALQKAMTQYIEYKADKSEGPFRISCEVNKTPIYWVASEEHTHVMGTECQDDASLFFIVPTEDLFHPSEFFITYYENREFDVTDPFMKLQIKKSKQPHYLASDSNVFGSSDGPLHLRSTVLVQQARFTLHSRVQPSTFMMCRSTPVTVSNWIEGEKFYINCSQRSFKIDGYIAIKKETDSSYKTVTVPTMKDPRKNTDFGMLFCLSKYKPPSQTSTAESDSEEEQTTPTTEAGGPPPPTTEAGGPPPPTTEAGGPPPPTTEAGGPPPPTTEAGGPPPPTTEAGGPTPPTTEAGGPPPPTTEAGGPPPMKGSKSTSSKSSRQLRPIVNPFSYSGQYQLIFGDD